MSFNPPIIMMGLGFLLFIISVISVLLTYRKFQLAAKIIIITITTYWIISSIYFSYLFTFQGRIVDAETKEPLEGTVVVATWHESTATITGGSTRFKDVRETLTDKNGKWRIRGSKGDRFVAQIFAMIPGIYYTKSPEFIIFKSGYCTWPEGFSIEACKGTIKPNGNDNIWEGDTVELPKLTKKEDRLKAQRVRPSLMDGDRDKLNQIKEFIRLKNEEREYLGLQKVDF